MAQCMTFSSRSHQKNQIERGGIIDVAKFHNQINAVSRAHTMNN